MKKLLILITFTCHGFVHINLDAKELANNYSSILDQLINKVSEENMDEHLALLRQKSPDSPDTWIHSANWVISRARKSTMRMPYIFDEVPANGSVPIKDIDGKPWIIDPKTGLPIAEVMTTEVSWDSALVTQSLEFLRIAQQRFPNRLDIIFAIAYIQEITGNYPGQVFALQKLRSTIILNKNDLKWGHGAPIKGSLNKFITDKLHPISTKHYRNETASGDLYFFKVNKLMVELFPREVRGWNNLAIYYSLKNDWFSAHKVLRQGLKVSPEDQLVITNLAMNAVRLGLKDEAIQLYEHLKVLSKSKRDQLEIDQFIKRLKSE